MATTVTEHLTADRRRAGRDRILGRRALALLGRPRRTGRRGRRRRDAAGARRRRRRAGAVRCPPTSVRACSTRSPRCSRSGSEEAARTISAEAGKPMKAARVEAARAASTFTFAAVEARKLAGEVVPMDASPAGEGKLAFTLRLPIGIVGAISPFNFPLNLVAHKIAPALAAGCPVVLKPAGVDAALCAVPRGSRARRPACRPAGSTSSPGPAAAIGDELVADERVKLITFTGSGAVGWGLAERAHRKRVKLELGNATPAIVCADAPAGHGGEARRERLLVRRPELHLGAAHLRRVRGLGRVRRGVRARGRRAEGRRSRRRRHRRRAADLVERARSGRSTGFTSRRASC